MTTPYLTRFALFGMLATWTLPAITFAQTPPVHALHCGKLFDARAGHVLGPHYAGRFVADKAREYGTRD